MGVDPGFASMGLAVLDGTSLVACDVVKTAKERAPRAQLRVSVDDARRMGELCAAIESMVEDSGAGAVAVEVFTVVPGKMAGGAVKTAMAYGALYALARARGLLWLPLVPTDLKRALCGRASASKGEVQHAVEARIAGATEALARLAKGKREHAADAMASALVGADELRRLAPALGRIA